MITIFEYVEYERIENAAFALEPDLSMYFLEAGTSSHITSLCHTGRRAVEVINVRKDRSSTFLRILTGVTKNSEISSI